jgi:hypothetical protein
LAQQRFRHIFLREPPDVHGFTSRLSGVPKKRIPDRDRLIHSAKLIQIFNDTWQEAENESAVYHADRQGVYIEFRGEPGADLVTKSLEDMRSKKVRLLNVRTKIEDSQAVTYATVYVANDKKRYFLDKIEDYAKKDTDQGNPKNADLIKSIANLRKALVESFWQDDLELVPKEEREQCEVWLSSAGEEVRQRFEHLLEREGIESVSGFISFPERTVKMILANKQDLERLTSISDDI